MRRISFLFLLLLSPLAAWENDYANALEANRHDKKPLLLYFTGSDWSGLAMKMKNEVLDSPPFEEKIRGRLLCVEIDFPRYTPLPSAKLEQNEKLKNRFHVEEYPLLLLLDHEEREIYRMGYVPENGAQLAEELMQIVAQDAELLCGLKNMPHNEEALLHLYQLSQDLGRTEAEEKIRLAGLEIGSSFFQLEEYRLLVETGKECAELREKLSTSSDYHVHFTLALIDFQQRAGHIKDPREVIKPLEAYLERFGDKDPHNVWRIEMMIAQFYLDTDEWNKALEHAQTAYEAAPGSMRGEIENSLEYIRGQIR